MKTDIHGATMWTEEIVEAIHGCTLFSLAISSHSTDSKNVVKELALACEREKKILPLYLEESQIPKNMEYQLAGIQNIALYTLDKAKGSAGKWIATAAGVVVLAVAGLFLINGGDKSTSKTPLSTAVAPAPTG